MKRLTDSRVAEDLKRNVKGLQKAGIEPDISDLRYIRLAAYEDAEERKEKTLVHY
jgi:hypothetical protein